MKICFVGNLSSTFIKRDYEILKKHFEIELIQPPNNKKAWIKYPSIVKDKVKKCDVVFGWFAGWHTAPAIYYSKKYKKKSIIVVGGYDAAYVPEINYGAFTNIKEKIPAKYVLENTNLLLPVSEFTKNEILEKVTPKGKIKVVYNGVDIELFKPQGKKNSKLAITVGGIKWNNLKRKGIEIFVNTAKYLPDTRFVVIGKFIDNSIEYLKKIAPTNVEFTGFVSENELIEWYQRAKIICQLSYYEAFGLAPAEGMSCECIPVVTKERAGLPEFVGDCGFYVPYGDEKATAEAIKEALEVPRELGKKARERIVKLFSHRMREERLIKTIEELA